MRKFHRALLASTILMVTACGSSEKPQSIQAIPENAADMTVDTVESVQIAEGLSSKTILQGDGAVAEAGQTAVVHYTGWLYDPEAPDYRGAEIR